MIEFFGILLFSTFIFIPFAIVIAILSVVLHLSYHVASGIVQKYKIENMLKSQIFVFILTTLIVILVIAFILFVDHLYTEIRLHKIHSTNIFYEY